jgi:hypothetical protein
MAGLSIAGCAACGVVVQCFMQPVQWLPHVCSQHVLVMAWVTRLQHSALHGMQIIVCFVRKLSCQRELTSHGS